ncbi:46269_t:CDS:2, partial [Gigaspora margarita]
PKQKEGEEIEQEKKGRRVHRSKGKRAVQAEDQKENKENRKEIKIKQLKRVTKSSNSKDKRKTEKLLVELIKRDNNLGIRILDIIEIAETNIIEKEGYFLSKDLKEYKAFRTEADPKKKKGLGFLFQQLKLTIIIIYLPPNDKNYKREVQQEIIKKTLNPQGTDHTWSRGKLGTRIDYIWITENLALGLKEVKIEDMVCFTGSDYNIPLVEVKLNKRITKAGVVKKWLIDNNPMVEDKTESALNSIWEALEKGILKTTIKHILKKKIYKTRAAKDGKKRPRLDKLIVELDRLVRKGKRKIGSDMTKEDRKNVGLFRENIRKKFQIEIENIDGKWEDKDIKDLSRW